MHVMGVSMVLLNLADSFIMAAIIFSGIAGLRSAANGSQMFTSMPYSKKLLSLCMFMYKRNWITSYSVYDKCIRIVYTHIENENILCDVIIRSSPGNRNYCNIKQLYRLCHKQRKRCYYVLSTSHGLLSSEEALSRNVGGELLMQISY